jgi:NO-binding membrane sensor protein with MHYT domain
LITVDHYTFGPLNPLLALALSVSGCLLGIMLASKARRRTGMERTRLMICATIAFGGIGIWLSQVIALLGLSMPPVMVRYYPPMLGLSLLVALVDVGTGLFLVTRGQPRAATLIPAGLVIGLGAAATSYTILVALRASADVTYDPVKFSSTVALCVLLAPFALWSIAALRGLLSTVVASGMLGLAICGIHYGGQWAMVVHFRQSRVDVPGLSGATLLAPMVLGGATATAMLAYFTIGASTLRELRAIYSPHGTVETIDPWLIEEVTTRVITGTTVTALALDHQPRHQRSRWADRPLPLPSIRPTWQRTPVWGSPDLATLARNDAERLRTWPNPLPRPQEPVYEAAPVVLAADPVDVLPRRSVGEMARAVAAGHHWTGAATIMDAATIDESIVLLEPEARTELPRRRPRNERRS